MNFLMKFIYPLIPNIKSYTRPTAEEFNKSPEGSRWVFECDSCEEVSQHVKQKDNTWMCCNCKVSTITFQEDNQEVSK